MWHLLLKFGKVKCSAGILPFPEKPIKLSRFAKKLIPPLPGKSEFSLDKCSAIVYQNNLLFSEKYAAFHMIRLGAKKAVIQTSLAKNPVFATSIMPEMAPFIKDYNPAAVVSFQETLEKRPGYLFRHFTFGEGRDEISLSFYTGEKGLGRVPPFMVSRGNSQRFIKKSDFNENDWQQKCFIVFGKKEEWSEYVFLPLIEDEEEAALSLLAIRENMKQSGREGLFYSLLALGQTSKANFFLGAPEERSALPGTRKEETVSQVDVIEAFDGEKVDEVVVEERSDSGLFQSAERTMEDLEKRLLESYMKKVIAQEQLDRQLFREKIGAPGVLKKKKGRGKRKNGKNKKFAKKKKPEMVIVPPRNEEEVIRKQEEKAKRLLLKDIRAAQKKKRVSTGLFERVSSKHLRRLKEIRRVKDFQKEKKSHKVSSTRHGSHEMVRSSDKESGGKKSIPLYHNHDGSKKDTSLPAKTYREMLQGLLSFYT